MYVKSRKVFAVLHWKLANLEKMEIIVRWVRNWLKCFQHQVVLKGKVHVEGN